MSWHFEASEEENENTEEYEYENKYEYNNQYFIQLANIIHEQNGVTANMKAMTDTIWLGKIEEETCTVGDISERSKDILSVKNFQLNPLTKMRFLKRLSRKPRKSTLGLLFVLILNRK